MSDPNIQESRIHVEDEQDPGQMKKKEEAPSKTHQKAFPPSLSPIGGFFEKAQLSPSICFIALMTCAAYLWLYLVIGPNCLSSVILAVSFILAFSIAFYVIYSICQKENWFNLPRLFDGNRKEEGNNRTGVNFVHLHRGTPEEKRSLVFDQR